MTSAELWALQITDLAVEALRQRLKEIDQQLGETAELLAARQAAAEAAAELERWQGQQRAIETQVRDLTDHIRSAEQQLMSGRVRNPKELEGMQANVASLERRRSALEDEILEAMLEIDRCREQARTADASLAQIAAAWQAEQARLSGERRDRLAEAQKLAARLKQQWEAANPADRDVYKDLRGRKSGRALSLVERNACQTCGVGLPTSLVQQVRAGEQHVFCPTCGRLLHIQN